MRLNILFSDFGLFLGLLGSVLIFFYGIAPAISRDGAILLSTGESTNERLKAQRYDFLAKLGIVSLFLAFALQLFGNHVPVTSKVKLNVLVAWAIFLLVVVCVYFIAWLLLVWRKRRLVLVGQYAPQYEQGSNAYHHLWIFNVYNETKKQVSPELHLPQEVNQIDIMQKGKRLRSVTNTNQAPIGDISPFGKVVIRVWNMAAISSVAKDTYMVAEGKTVIARILDSIGYD